MTTEQRLERLERENRWMRRFVIGSVAVAVAVAIPAAGVLLVVLWVPRALEGESLTLIAPHGETCAYLGWDSMGGSLKLYDNGGKVIWKVPVRGDGGTVIGQEGKDKEPPDLVVRSLTIKNKDGRICALLRMDADGSVGLNLHDQDGRTRAGLVTLADGATALTLADKDTEPRAVLRTLADGSPCLTLFDAKGNVLWQAPR